MDGLPASELALPLAMIITALASILFSVLRVSRARTEQALLLHQELVKEAAFLAPAFAVTAYLWVWGGADRWVTRFDELALLLVVFGVVYWVPFFCMRLLNELTRR